jgi:hypothetical protein
MELELPTLQEHPITLEPRTVRGPNGDSVTDPLAGAITVGGPVSIGLTPERVAEDAQLRAFVEAETQYRYHLVYLAGTFLPAEDEPFKSVRLVVKLFRKDASMSSLPLAWSMQPERLEDQVETSSKATLGADLKILNLGLERGSSRTLRNVSLQALHLLESNPTWVLERTKSGDISGCQRFVLVVRSHVEAPAAGRVEIHADVDRKRFPGGSYHTPFEHPPAPLEFALA